MSEETNYRTLAAPVISPTVSLSLDGKNCGCHQINDGQCCKHLLKTHFILSTLNNMCNDYYGQQWIIIVKYELFLLTDDSNIIVLEQ